MTLKLRSFSHFLILSIVLSISLLTNYKIVFGQYRFESWTTDDGLPQNGVRRIVQTPDGYLWFTTFDGLVRFDGLSFKTYNKSITIGIFNSRFNYLYGDQDGTLYASTTSEIGSLSIYRNGEFISYLPDQVPGNYIAKIDSNENGEIIFTTVNEVNSNSLYKFQSDEFIFQSNIETNSNIECNGKFGTKLIATPAEIIEQTKDKQFVYKDSAKHLDSFIFCFEDSDGGFWIGGAELRRIQNGKMQDFRQEINPLPNLRIHSFWEDEDKSIWFATGSDSGFGIGLIRYKDGKFTVFGEKEGLSDPTIFHIFKDREENTWLATNKGINRLRKAVMTSYSKKDGINHPEIGPLYRDKKNNIWIGTTGGINVYSNEKFSPFVYEAPPNKKDKFTDLTRYSQAFLEDSNGKMWIGTSEGILIKDGNKLNSIEETLSYVFYGFYEDENNNVWAITNKGILVFNDYKIQTIYSTQNGLIHNHVISMLKDTKGSFWFGTFGGLSEFKNGQFTNYSLENGLGGNTIRTIYEDKTGTLWIGTYDEGLSRFKDGKFTNYKLTDGLFNNGVFAIQEDNKGFFWISSNVGIYRVKISELNDFADGKIDRIKSVSYGKSDGMFNSECNGGRQQSSLKDQNGHIWFPTQDGVVVVNPELEMENKFPPKVVIETATVEKNAIDIREKLIVNPGQRNIEITYTGISFTKSDQIKFKYKLDGHDFNWVEAETRRSAFYSYLPPGEYKFKVIAANSDGVWNNEGAVVTLEVKPFFYQTNLFNFIIIALIGIILIIVWRISIFRFRKRERELAQLVNEKTIELRQANEELQTLATSDQLTQVGNRRFFEENLEKEWNRAARSKKPLSLLLIDVDYFKIFNDTYGHQLGDNCLKLIAASLKKSIKRPSDSVSRYGGEEFAVILGDTDAKGALHIANLIQENVFELDIKHERSFASTRVTVSIGVTTINSITQNTSQTELITSADQALYKAKENGRDQIISKEI